MKGIFIVARMGSQRLPEKHLAMSSGKMMIEWLILRLHASFKEDIACGNTGIFIVTSEKKENKKFETLLTPRFPFLKVFYGSDGNIPLRQWQCAMENNVDVIISIDGDDILCSAAAARLVAENLTATSPFVKTEGLPLGMNAMGYGTSFLGECINGYRQKEKLETGWGKIFEGREAVLIRLADKEPDKTLRFTLDYEEDRKFFQSVIAHFGDRVITIADDELINYVIDAKTFLLNSSVNEAYWENFQKQKKEE